MNFLSHYYLHKKEDDNFFTVGLTAPDLLGFHTKKVRVTEIYLTKKNEELEDVNLKSSINGMLTHLSVDRWFHNSDFFNDGCSFLRENYKKITGKNDISHFICHILLEILVDRYLLLIKPQIADDFYESYNKFDFSKLIDVFCGLSNFDGEKFISLTDDIKKSSFLKSYTNDYAVGEILNRTSRRINLSVSLEADTEKLALFFRKSFLSLEKLIPHLFEKANEEFFKKLA
jgi:hypothetical protein